MKGRPRRKLTQGEYTALTGLRIESAYKAYSLKQLTELLSRIGKGFWKDPVFITFMMECGIISRTAHNRYAFDKVFNYEQLEKAVHRYQCQKAKMRIRRKKVLKEEVIIATPINPIEEAISLLKANGYTVSKRHFDLEKALENPSLPVQNFVVETVY